MSKDTENDESEDKGGDASKPKSTDDLKRFLNSDPDELPDAEASTPDFGPGGEDASRSESDVGRGEDDDNKVADQPLSAQQSEDDVPDDIRKPEELDEEGEAMDKDSGAEKETS